MHQIDKLPAECGECQQPVPQDWHEDVFRKVKRVEHQARQQSVLYAAAVKAFGENPVAAMLGPNMPRLYPVFMNLRSALRAQMEKQDG